MSSKAVRNKLSGARRKSFYRRELQRNGGRLICIYCNIEVFRGHEDLARQATIEHIVPIAMGGTHRKENMAVACYLCNAGKGADLSNQLQSKSLTFKIGEVA